MSRMHRPDPKRPPHMQDKRSVIPVERSDVDEWLFGTFDQAKALMRLAPVDEFLATPVQPGGLSTS
jgi:putative SOS response-associated peptidase YedK